MLQVIILGVALASLWYWIDVVRKDYKKNTSLLYWALVIVPQGVAIAYALQMLGVLNAGK